MVSTLGLTAYTFEEKDRESDVVKINDTVVIMSDKIELIRSGGFDLPSWCKGNMNAVTRDTDDMCDSDGQCARGVIKVQIAAPEDFLPDTESYSGVSCPLNVPVSS